MALCTPLYTTDTWKGLLEDNADVHYIASFYKLNKYVLCKYCGHCYITLIIIVGSSNYQ